MFDPRKAGSLLGLGAAVLAVGLSASARPAAAQPPLATRAAQTQPWFNQDHNSPQNKNWDRNQNQNQDSDNQKKWNNDKDRNHDKDYRRAEKARLEAERARREAEERRLAWLRDHRDDNRNNSRHDNDNNWQNDNADHRVYHRTDVNHRDNTQSHDWQRGQR